MDVYDSPTRKMPPERRMTEMNNRKTRLWLHAPLAITIAGTVGTAVLVALRVVLMPLLRDVDTGRFDTNLPALIFLAMLLAVMAVTACFTPRDRVDIPSSRALPTALSGMLAGGALGLVIFIDTFRWLFGGILPPPEQIQLNTLSRLVMYAMLVFGILGAVALVRWGLQVASEGGTRRGMSAFGALAPVMWTWCRLAWCEMSYVSTVGWSEKAYDFLMVIFEMLFLFKLARFVSGIGKTSTGEMLFYAMAAAMLALSGPLVRICLYFTGGAEAYLASDLAGIADVGVGVLALTFAWSLVRGYREELSARKDEEEGLEQDDTPYDSTFESLFVTADNEASEYNQP